MTVLLFDIDNTLLDFDKAEYDALGKIFTHYQIEDNQENRATYSRENKALWRLHESEKLSREELLSTRFDHAFRALNVSVIIIQLLLMMNINFTYHKGMS